MAELRKAPITVRINADLKERADVFKTLGLLDYADVLERGITSELTVLEEFEAQARQLKDAVEAKRRGGQTQKRRK